VNSNGSRWRLLRVLFALGATFCAVVLFIFVTAILVNPELNVATLLKRATDGFRPARPVERFMEQTRPAEWLKPSTTGATDATHGVTANPPSRLEESVAGGQPSRTVRLGFVSEDDPRSIESLRSHGKALTHIVAGRITVSGMPGSTSVSFDDEVAKWALENGVNTLPLLTNLKENKFDPEAIEYFLQEGADVQSRFAWELVVTLRNHEAAGVLVEWEELDPAYQNELVRFIQILHDVLKESQLELWLSVPVGNDLKYLISMSCLPM
jgi:hypothetical protein